MIYPMVRKVKNLFAGQPYIEKTELGDVKCGLTT